MNSEYFRKIYSLWQEVTLAEKKKLDPVNKKELDKDYDDRTDKDIDNDGDTDKSDEYLHNRRKTIKKAMAKEDIDEFLNSLSEEQLDEISGKLARKAAAASQAKSFEYGSSAYGPGSDKETDRLDKKADKARAHVQKRQGDKGVKKVDRMTGKLIYGRNESVELEEQEGALAKQWRKGGKSLKVGNIELVPSAPGKSHKIKVGGKEVGSFILDPDVDDWIVTIGKSPSSVYDIGRKPLGKQYYVDQIDDVVATVRKHVKGADMKESVDISTKSVDKALSHDCAKHVASEQWGFGECIPGQHTLVEQEDGTAIVTHYDVMFEHGVEFDVPVEDLEILVSESHKHTAKKKMKEGKTYADRTKGAAKAETMKDKFKGKAALDMAKDANMDNPELAADDAKGHEDATKVGRAVKGQAPARPGEKRMGDKSILRPVKGAVTSTTGKEG